MIYSKIVATGSYLPKQIVTNKQLIESKGINSSDEWIYSRTGIKQRHIAKDNETTSGLAYLAAKAAFEKTDWDNNSIDLIIVSTTTPDKIFPSVACQVQTKLGITNQCPAFDLQAVCAGFTYGISVADQYIKAGTYKRVLLIGSETMSRIMNWQDRSTCVLFGDGAGAFLIEASDEPGIYSTHIHSDGNFEQFLHVPTGISILNTAVTPDEKNANTKLHMQGNEVFKFAVNILSKIVNETLSKNNFSNSDLDWLVPHQANYRIIKSIAKKLNMTEEQVIITIDKHGNTSSASIPISFDIGVNTGKIKRGQNILVEGFGGGFTWGSAIFRY